MVNREVDKVAGILLLLGAPFATCFLLLSTVTDPVNAPKLLVTGALGFALVALFLGFNLRDHWKNYKFFILSALVFLIAAVNATLNSESPLTQNLYGAYGRNTGLVAYIALVGVAIGALTLRSRGSFNRLLIGLQIAGAVNVAYCAWVLAFGDFLSWNNPYGNILGLFGNPNFIGAFLGIFITTIAAIAVAPKTNAAYRVFALLFAALAFYEVVRSSAVQGLVVTAGGLALVGYFLVRAHVKSKIFSGAYLVASISVGIVAVLGALQKGPLDSIYKYSVSLRGSYWNAGIAMGLDHPFTGVGMDAYGDWYRRARSLNAATSVPGPRTVTNAAHNVVIDFFAFGGWPLLLAYCGILLLAAISVIKVMRRSTVYDAVFVGMTVAWTCYQVQSLISINQIGLALWGWLLSGALVAYEYSTREKSELNEPSKGRATARSTSGSLFSPQLLAGLGVVVGLIIASPPVSADMKWRAALNSQDANKVMEALKPAYLNPSDSQKFAQAVILFANSNLMDQAREVALQGIEFNSDSFDAWKVFYNLPNTTADEKENALKNMKRLDPLNPDVLA